MTITVCKLYALADRPLESAITPEADEAIHVARVPINIAEARAMLAMSMLADGCMYAGYTNDELAVLPAGAQISAAEANEGIETEAKNTRTPASKRGVGGS